MGKFLQFVFASCLGFVLGMGALALIGAGIMGSFASSANKTKEVSSNSVLELKLNQAIPEKTNNMERNPYEFSTESILGLQGMKVALEEAGKDDNIKGIFLDLTGIQTGQASSSTLRKAILDFKAKEKFIVAYSQYYSEGAYFMASAADKVIVHPMGGIDFNGFGGLTPFFKDMLDRVGVKMQIYYAGKFKSATEPFRRNDMSEASRLQMREYMDGMYGMFLQDIADARSVEVSELQRIANEYLIREADDAVKYGLADQVGYRDEAYSYLRKRLGIEEDDKLKMVSLGDYAKGHKPKSEFSIKDKIAVVYAEGNIVGGKGSVGSIGGQKYASIIRKLRKDDKVKAIVLRVNSPGGSAMASEEIWRELMLAKEAGKPVVCSMGDLAASGGYYVACPADTIFAAPNTITGSIGVFSMIPSLEKTLSEKVGVHFDDVKTGPFALGLTPFRDITEEEGEILQQSTERIYETFLKRVSDGRKMTRDQVHAVAQGRVWTGAKAKELGLVDRFGELEDAIACAGRMAGLEKYRTSEYPKLKDPVQQMIETLTGQSSPIAKMEVVAQDQLGDLYPYYKQLRSFNDLQGVQARLPFVPMMEW